MTAVKIWMSSFNPSLQACSSHASAPLKSPVRAAALMRLVYVINVARRPDKQQAWLLGLWQIVNDTLCEKCWHVMCNSVVEVSNKSFNWHLLWLMSSISHTLWIRWPRLPYVLERTSTRPPREDELQPPPWWGCCKRQSPGECHLGHVSNFHQTPEIVPHGA